MPDLTDVKQVVNPPWKVGKRPTAHSMFPIRDADGKVVAYAYREYIAGVIVALLNESDVT